jgi:cytochrome o ubiquinol oxidase subunit II
MSYPMIDKVTRCTFPRAWLLSGVLMPIANTVQAGDWLDLQHQGPISAREDQLLMLTLGLMLIVVVPVLAMTFGFAWRYRANNPRATYEPEWNSNRVDLLVWAVPSLIVALLAVLTWTYTHRLNPYSPIESPLKPLKVQVVALDWKWLFIYPELGIASVNELALPTHRPIRFDLTSDTVMNSFFIPQLGGQIYAMAGMRTELHLIADKPGTYFGENTQYSGRGFPFQHFRVEALPEPSFDTWVEKVKQHGAELNWTAYQMLHKPSVRVPPSFYTLAESALFKHILSQYTAMHPAPGSTPRSHPDVR